MSRRKELDFHRSRFRFRVLKRLFNRPPAWTSAPEKTWPECAGEAAREICFLRSGERRDKLRQDRLGRISPRKKLFEDTSGIEQAEVPEVDSGLLNDAQHLIGLLTVPVMVFQGGRFHSQHVNEGPAGPSGQRQA